MAGKARSMIEQDRQKFCELMVGLAENFGREISEVGLEMRFTALEAFTIQEVEEATYNLLKYRKYTTMPTIAEFIEHLAGSPEDQAISEATRTLAAIKSIGHNESVAFDNPTTQAVIQQGFGGWVKMCCELRENDEKWFIKDFCKIYQAYARQKIEVRGHLAGEIEAHNSAHGYFDHIKPPLLIGDKEKAKQIAAGDGKLALPEFTLKSIN